MTIPQSYTAQIRRALDIAFDDTELSAFCFDYFRIVYDRFSRGMRKDDKISLFLDHCRREPTGFERLLDCVRQEYFQSNSSREVLSSLIEALEAYLNPSQEIESTEPKGPSGTNQEGNTQSLSPTERVQNLERLISEGANFSYENFAKKSPRGRPQSLSPKWLLWIETIERQLFFLPKNSAAIREYNEGKDINLRGSSNFYFKRAKEHFLNSLKIAKKNLEDIIPVPAPPSNIAYIEVDLIKLSNIIEEIFDRQELVKLGQSFGVDYEKTYSREQKELAWELITCTVKHNKLIELIDKVRSECSYEIWVTIFNI